MGCGCKGACVSLGCGVASGWCVALWQVPGPWRFRWADRALRDALLINTDGLLINRDVPRLMRF